MVDEDAGNWKVNRIVTENAPSAAHPPPGHRAFASPPRRAPSVRPVSSANRPSRRLFSAFAIQHSAFAAVAECNGALKPLGADRKRRPNLPSKKQNEFCETNPKIRVFDHENADSARGTNPIKPAADRENLVRPVDPQKAERPAETVPKNPDVHRETTEDERWDPESIRNPQSEEWRMAKRPTRRRFRYSEFAIRYPPCTLHEIRTTLHGTRATLHAVADGRCLMAEY